MERLALEELLSGSGPGDEDGPIAGSHCDSTVDTACLGDPEGPRELALVSLGANDVDFVSREVR